MYQLEVLSSCAELMLRRREAHDMSLHLEGKIHCARVFLPVNVCPCVRTPAKTHAWRPAAMLKDCCIHVPGTLYMQQALQYLVHHGVALRLLSVTAHADGWFYQSRSHSLKLGKSQSPTCATSIVIALYRSPETT